MTFNVFKICTLMTSFFERASANIMYILVHQRQFDGAGVATAFAAKDVMGNMLCGVGLQFSRPFSIGDSITVHFVDPSLTAVHLHFCESTPLSARNLPLVNKFHSSPSLIEDLRI